MIADMVKAHLENVRSAISDLEQQKQNIDSEIIKLKNYLQKGVLELNTFENSVTTEPVTKNVNVVTTKNYLGD